MKAILLTVALSALPLLGHAEITSCNAEGSELVRNLVLVADVSCPMGHLAAINNQGNKECIRALSENLTAPGHYRACIVETSYGLAVTMADKLSAE